MGSELLAEHVIVIPLPVQGHINPMLQFSKRLASKGVRVTLLAPSYLTSYNKYDDDLIRIESVSEDDDETPPKDIDDLLDWFETLVSGIFKNLVNKMGSFGCPAKVVVYDALLPWAQDLAENNGLKGAAFFTQSCAVCGIYYLQYSGRLKIPTSSMENSPPVLLPETTTAMGVQDLPSFVVDTRSYPSLSKFFISQNRNFLKADWLLFNSFDSLEKEVNASVCQSPTGDRPSSPWLLKAAMAAGSLHPIFRFGDEALRLQWLPNFSLVVEWISHEAPIMTIGPTIPSMYLDKRLKDDKDYGMSMFKPNSEACIKWLDSKETGSVVYVSFGSLASLGEKQMEELAWGLLRSDCYFLWVVRNSEENKLPRNFKSKASEKGLIVNWSPQLEVLAHPAIGCFVTHCGWNLNLTLEALSLGVPMVGMPQWTDQPTNAKYITDVWKTGIRVRVGENGTVTREEIEDCIRQVMVGEKGTILKSKALKWRELAKEAGDIGGSSDKNIEEFLSQL